MFILGNFLEAIAYILNTALTVYIWIIIARAVISWVNPDPYNPLVQFLYRSTEPALALFRRLLPLGGMGMDFSPFILILLIIFIKKFLITTLFQVAFRLKI